MLKEFINGLIINGKGKKCFSETRGTLFFGLHTQKEKVFEELIISHHEGARDFENSVELMSDVERRRDKKSLNQGHYQIT